MREAEDLGLSLYAALPRLAQSDNPDVARFAAAGQEIATTVVFYDALFRLLGIVSALLVVPYWIGMGMFLVHTGLTGWPFLLALFGLEIVVPFLLLAPGVVRLLATVVLIVGVVLGVRTLTAPTPRSVPTVVRGWVVQDGGALEPATKQACDAAASYGWTWDGLNCIAADNNPPPT